MRKSQRSAGLALGLVILFASSADAQWSCLWQSRVQLSFDNSAQAESLIDFPVLVSLTSLDVDFAKIEPGGADIRFLDADGTTSLPYEIDAWDDVAETASVWVKVPRIDAGSTTDHIWLYYDNTGAADAQDADAVWDSSYVGVWHLEESGDGTAGEFTDSSGAGHHGQGGGGSPLGVPGQTPTGKIGNAQSFDGAADFVSLPDSAALNISGPITLAAWVQTTGTGYDNVVGGYAPGSPWSGYGLSIGNTNEPGKPAYWSGSGSAWRGADSTVNDGAWHHVALVASGTTVTFYRDGIADGTRPSGEPDAYAGVRRIGMGTDDTDPFSGAIDDVRISDVARSADWIAAQYRSQAGTFVSYGLESQPSPGECLWGGGVVVPARPVDHVFADLNGDGRQDMVAAHPTLSSVSVSLATGPGTFAVPMVYPAGVGPSALRLGDMDQDGDLDAVVGGDGAVTIVLGDGSGGFGAPASFSAGAGPLSLVLLDSNLDGSLDVVVADETNDQIVVLAGDGTGEVSVTSSFSAGAGPMGIASGDVNGDGLADIVIAVANAPGAVVFLGDGVSYQPPTYFSAGTGPMAVALGDLDDDGNLDIVLADPPSDSIVILAGEEIGGFGPPRSFSAGTGPMALVVTDFNGDCRLDVATANAGSADVTVLMGDGAGGVSLLSSFAVGGVPSAITTLDVQPDGRTDVAVSQPDSDQIVIIVNHTDAFQAPVITATASVLCAGDSATLDAGPGYESYSWSTGETTQAIVVAPAVGSTEYSVEVTGTSGCATAAATLTVKMATLVSTEVSGVMLANSPDGVVVSYGSVGAWGYNLYRYYPGEVPVPGDFVQQVRGHVPFTDQPPAGTLVMYAVRGTNVCPFDEGP